MNIADEGVIVWHPLYPLPLSNGERPHLIIMYRASVLSPWTRGGQKSMRASIDIDAPSVAYGSQRHLESHEW
jgi:hypothetical protein